MISIILSTERPFSFACQNRSIPVVDRRGSKRPVGLRRRSQAANGLPGLPLPGGDRARPARRGRASSGDQVARGREVCRWAENEGRRPTAQQSMLSSAKLGMKMETLVPSRCALLYETTFLATLRVVGSYLRVRLRGIEHHELVRSASVSFGMHC